MKKRIERLRSEALEQFKAGDLAKSEMLLSEALRIDPSETSIRLLRGQIRFNRADFAQSLEDLTCVIETSSDYEEVREAYMQRAHTYQGLRDLNGLLSDLTWRIENDEPHDTLLMWRASVHRKLQNFESAVRDYTRVLKQYPDRVEVLTNRAFVFNDMQRYDDAIADTSNAIARILTDHTDQHFLPFVLDTRGRAFLGRGDRERALQDFNEFAALKGMNPFPTPEAYLEQG